MEQAELRYADGPATEASIEIDAPAATIWALVTDIQLPSRFSGEFLGAEWLEGATAPVVGARFVGRNQHAAVGTWETTSTIVELEPERVLAYAVGEPNHPSTTWRFTLEPAGERRTRLTQWMRMGPARTGINAAIDAMPDKESRILHRRLAELRSNMEATLAGIKELAEA